MVKKTTQKEFVEKAILLHGNNFTFDKVNYINSKNKVTVTCVTHGDYEVYPHSFLQGYGCKKCAFEKRSKSNVFVKNANKVHDFKYNYSLVKYRNRSTKVEIICPEHGSFFQQPVHHLSGHGCGKCSGTYSDRDDFIRKSKIAHGPAYDYSLVDYINNFTKVTIICPEHGKFDQLPANHKNKHGCPKCNTAGFSKNRWIEFCNRKNKESKIYLIECFNDNENFIKIGITTNKLKYRFGNHFMPYKYNILYEKKYDPGLTWDLEKNILNLFNKFKYNPKIKFKGYNETFKNSIKNDILNILLKNE